MNDIARDKRYLTVSQAAVTAGVSQSTIRRWLREGVLKRHRLGPGRGFVRVLKTELEALITPRAEASDDRR